MIVDPDLFEHWRTRMLADLLGGDEMTPLYLIRLWAHCQLRRNDTFVMPAQGLKAVCRFRGDAQAFEESLIESGWVSREGDKIIALKWLERNKALKSAWDNGDKGGRPKKPIHNPSVTHSKPTGNPLVTQRKPIGNPLVTHSEPIGEERTGEDRKSREEGAAPPPAVVGWDSNGFTVCQTRIDGWSKAYPLIDIPAQIQKAHAWYIDNPSKRKKNHTRFLGSWMSRSQKWAEENKPQSHAKRQESYNHPEDFGGAA